MELSVTDWKDFTWFLFSWSRHSHPAICIRFRFFKYIFALLYFRWRPSSYLKTYPPGVFDKHMVFEGPCFYKDRGTYV